MSATIFTPAKFFNLHFGVRWLVTAFPVRRLVVEPQAADMSRQVATSEGCDESQHSKLPKNVAAKAAGAIILTRPGETRSEVEIIITGHAGARSEIGVVRSALEMSKAELEAAKTEDRLARTEHERVKATLEMLKAGHAFAKTGLEGCRSEARCSIAGNVGFVSGHKKTAAGRRAGSPLGRKCALPGPTNYAK